MRALETAAALSGAQTGDVLAAGPEAGKADHLGAPQEARLALAGIFLPILARARTHARTHARMHARTHARIDTKSLAIKSEPYAPLACCCCAVLLW